MGGHRPRSAVLVAGYHGADLISPTVNFRATIPSVNDRVQPDTGAMSTLQSWAQCSIIAVAKPGASFLMALLVAVVVGLLKEAGAAAALAIGAVSVVGSLLVRRLRWHSRSALDCPGNGKLGTDPDRTVFRI